MKTDREAASQVIKNCIQIVKAVTLLIEPVIPAKAQECWSMLGCNDNVSYHPLSEAVRQIPETCIRVPVPPLCKDGRGSG